MDVETAIRTRRTHKAFAAEPLGADVLRELFELASWAPNHHLTVPWRFRVIGPESLERLKEVAGPEGATKLERCPTLVVVTSRQSGDPVGDEEDLHATAVAAYIVLLAAHGRGLAGYWRTPGLLRSDEGRAAARVPAGERVVGLLHLGHPRQERPVPERPRLDDTVVFLD